MKRSISVLVAVVATTVAVVAPGALATQPSLAQETTAQEDVAGEDSAIGGAPARLVPLYAGDNGARGMAVSGEYLIQLGDRELHGKDVQPVGFGWYLLRDGSLRSPATRAAELTAELGVVVVPNGVSQLFAENPEPDAFLQWPLDQIDATDPDIATETAWDITMGDGAVVAVLDSGIDLDHPDLAASLWLNPGEVPNNGLDDDGNNLIDDVYGWDFVAEDGVPEDSAGAGTGHGSLVSGIIAAPINGVGIAGVAPEAKVMVLRVCGTSGCFDSDVIAGLAYAASKGADVVNMSLGRGPGDPFSDDVFQTAISETIAAGTVVVAAAGNDGVDNDTVDPDPFMLPNWPAYPASFPVAGLVSVAMTDDFDALDSFSNYGLSTVDLGAPGVAIYSTFPVGLGSYAAFDGTSFAAPHVAGAAALIAAQDGCLTPAEIEARIKRNADRIASLSGLVATGARLNAHRALTGFTATSSQTYGGVPLTVDFALDTCSGSFPWDFGDGATGSGPSVSHTYGELGLYEASVDINGTIRRFEIVAGLDFLDTVGNPFELEIAWLAATGVTLGCDPAGPLFCPDDTVTRGQMASFLARALALPPASQDYFTDDETSAHQDNINRLREAGVTLGCDAAGTLFCPDDEITREQMATFLVRGYDLAPSATDYFTDDGGVHEANINALAASGITLGCEGDLFCPKDSVPRRQMAAFLYRAQDFA